MRTLFMLMCSPLLAVVAAAQAPSERWMTLETAHFRVHYPADYEAWTLHLASRMESIHQAVTEEVGFAPKGKADILVMDPLSLANGMALPFLQYPRVILWTTPPEAWSPIGHYRNWQEMVFLHEDVHLVHLLRPSRGAWGRFIEHLLPLGAINRKVPRWVSEGYATYLEGKMTGVGRPNGDFRAAVLRKWAMEGKLPSYRQMISDDQSWLGMTMAYLMGSAYMEWLVQRTDEGAWKRLWARLSAKKDRSFEAAFEGVFGDNPVKLYDRYRAEVTWKAMELERRMKPSLIEGELWQDTSWTTGEPAISPDGTKMAIVLRAKDEPSRLVVWDLRPDPEAEKKWEEEKERILKKDPEDVPGLRAKPFPAKVLFEMSVSAAREPTNPRWMPDGKSILFTSYEPDTDGYYSPDLFLWTPETGEVRRVTRGAHLKEADPLTDGKRAVAVQSRYGGQELVVVDLESGQTNSFGVPGGLEVVFDHPRVHPDGVLCYMRHQDGRWAVVARSLSGNAEKEMPLPEGVFSAYPVWDPANRRLLAAIGTDGFINICAWGEGDALTPLTQVRGAAVAPQPTPDGQGIYFLSLETDGLKVRYLKTDQPPPPTESIAEREVFAPALRPAPPAESAFKSEEPGKPRLYGAGRQEFSLLFGGTYASSTQVMEIGSRGGDVLGRWNYFAIYSHAPDKGIEGGALAVAYRGWPVEWSLHAYSVDECPSECERLPPPGPIFFSMKRKGVELKAGKELFLRRTSISIHAGGLWEKVQPVPYLPYGAHPLGFISLKAVHACPFGSLEGVASINASQSWGRNQAWQNRGAFSFSYSDFLITAGIRKTTTSVMISCDLWRANNEFIQLGGIQGSSMPESAYFGYGRVLAPALPLYSMVGTKYKKWRADLSLAGFPLFYERHQMWFEEHSRNSHSLSLAGFEWDITSGPMAVARLPGFHLTLGGAYIFDPPLQGKTRLWLGLAWKP